MKQTIFIASDHRGWPLKEELKSQFKEMNWEDLGPLSSTPVNYPDYADKLCNHLKEEDQRGVLICGTGQGMAIKANRFPHIRAALCWSPEVAGFSRKHNNANVLCLPGTLIPFSLCFEVLQTFLKTEFEEGRHQQRVSRL